MADGHGFPLLLRHLFVDHNYYGSTFWRIVVFWPMLSNNRHRVIGHLTTHGSVTMHPFIHIMHIPVLSSIAGYSDSFGQG